MTLLRRRALLAGAAALGAPALVRAQGAADWPKGPVAQSHSTIPRGSCVSAMNSSIDIWLSDSS